MPNLQALNDMFLEYRAVRINLRSLGLPGLTSEQAKTYVEGAKNAIAAYEVANKQYQDIPFLPGQKEKYEALNKAWTHFKSVGARALTLHEDGSPTAKEQLNQIFLHDCPEAAKDYTEVVKDLKKFHNDHVSTHSALAKATGDNTNQIVIITSIAGILAGLIVGYILSITTEKLLSHITTVAQQLASNADQVTAASSQIASSSQELSQASTEQASSLEQTAASLEEITSMIAKATDNAETTSKTASESQLKAEEGRGAVDQMLSSMDDISQSNEAILSQISESNRQMAEIVKVIQDIGNRTKVINEIVFQTKLLSFNASVEAARAGEQGKGFAVVAEEVGNLAQMSGNAAKEITEMLEVSISKVEGIVRDTQQKVEVLVQTGKEKVDAGVTVAQQCANILSEIVQNVSRVSGLSQEISHAAKEQSQGVSEINKAMSQLDTVTQQNAATSEEAASAAEELSAQAESLKASVAELMTVISGDKAAGFSPSSTTSKSSSESVKSSQSNVVHLKSVKRKSGNESQPTSAGSFHKASGDDFVPSRDDDGFKDV